MRFGILATRALGAAVTVATFAGCSGGAAQLNPAGKGPASTLQAEVAAYRPMMGSSGALSVLPEGFMPKQGRPSWMKPPPPGSAGSHLAVAQFGGSSVLWFRANDRRNKPPAICEPASSTNGIRIDAASNLWVPDGRANTTTEYGPNCGAAKLTIPDPMGEPADVGFDSKGDVYIMNINDHFGLPPTIGVYTASGKPIRTLSDPSFSNLFGIGTDSNDNIYVSNLKRNNVGNIVEFPGGKMPGTALGVSLGLPGSPVFDQANNLIITDWLALTLDVFAPPYNQAPSTSPIKGFAIWCPLSHDEKQIYCGDAEYGAIDVYAYPGGAYRYSYTSGLSASALVTGVAPDPPAPL